VDHGTNSRRPHGPSRQTTTTSRYTAGWDASCALALPFTLHESPLGAHFSGSDWPALCPGSIPSLEHGPGRRPPSARLAVSDPTSTDHRGLERANRSALRATARGRSRARPRGLLQSSAAFGRCSAAQFVIIPSSRGTLPSAWVGQPADAPLSHRLPSVYRSLQDHAQAPSRA